MSLFISPFFSLSLSLFAFFRYISRSSLNEKVPSFHSSIPVKIRIKSKSPRKTDSPQPAYASSPITVAQPLASRSINTNTGGSTIPCWHGVTAAATSPTRNVSMTSSTDSASFNSSTHSGIGGGGVSIRSAFTPAGGSGRLSAESVRTTKASRLRAAALGELFFFTLFFN